MLGPGYRSNPHILSRCLSSCAIYLNTHVLLVLFCHCRCCFPTFASAFELKLGKESSSNCILSLDRLRKEGCKPRLDWHPSWSGCWQQRPRCSLIRFPFRSLLVRVYRAASCGLSATTQHRMASLPSATGSSFRFCYMNLQLLSWCP